MNETLPHYVEWISPIMFQIGPFQAHWYGFMYALLFLLGYLYIQYSRHGKTLPLSAGQKDSLVGWTILGILLGGRLGYALFYNAAYYFENPAKIFAVWEGGMASHGALLGALLAIYLFCLKKKVKMLPVTDVLAAYAPVGIILIRIGNFINAELYGRIVTSDSPQWAQNLCLYFPTDPQNCRYPSQLFQAFLEGFILLLLLQLAARSARPGLISALFLLLYGIFRIIGEQFRQPDPQIGLYFGAITQGQIFSGLMVLAGIGLLLTILRSPTKKLVKRP